MPLLDHFHPPLAPARKWPGLHGAWAAAIASDLNARLPRGYFAESSVHFQIEVDVASMRRPGAEWPDEFDAARRWQPTAPTATVPFAVASDEVEILVFGGDGEATLVGAIELLSPANKDRPGSRDDFNAKCQSYLKTGVGVIVVDIVTTRWADIHAELLTRLDPEARIAPIRSLAVTSYRPDAGQLVIWRELLAIGAELPPTMPLWLKTGACLPVHLAATYRQVCAGLKLDEGIT